MARVLRLTKGSRIKLVDETQRLYAGVVEHVSGDSVRVSIQEESDCAPEHAKLIMILGIPRLPKADLVVQKLTELGVGRIVFVPLERSPYSDALDRLQKRLQRLRSIAEAAAKQCARRCVPAVEACESLEKVFTPMDENQVCMVADERYNLLRLRDALPAIISFPIYLFIGPEGGFSDDEIDFLLSKNCVQFSLGCNILRTETAAIVAAALILYEVGEL
jgi:16S rRNA (uracil1498-N3)-methyltransferase